MLTTLAAQVRRGWGLEWEKGRKGLPGGCLRAWGPTPSPPFAQAPADEAVGPGFGPSPSAKNSRPGLCGKPRRWGRMQQGLCRGGEEGGQAGNALALPTPQQSLGSVGTVPWKVPGVPWDLHRAGAS